jgi:hypothetical protein
MVALQRLLATCGNGHLGRLGHGLGQESSKHLRIVGSLVGYEVDQVACGGAHTAVVTGTVQATFPYQLSICSSAGLQQVYGHIGAGSTPSSTYS